MAEASFNWSTCDGCGAEEKPESSVKLKACSKCKKTHYCNKDCQKCACHFFSPRRWRCHPR